ncbi:hypothetical protein ROZALSC1DRAFT_27793 [Rozella allomycis CSF55]|uniref:Uncharacterized protein n=1 Tax=Rozella allomycis (strain CSF55) TaxID=988480 RepID=A0A4P9YNZ0_ROZAC|nr:hypothetical protein ROZALSC1DRAFT_27793 [Rozella allomycis CSF55]
MAFSIFKKRENIYTFPNALTTARLILSPYIAYNILNQNYPLALTGFVFAGLSDATENSTGNIFGSSCRQSTHELLYIIIVENLFAPKFIIAWLTALIIGRDVCLLGVTMYLRYKMLTPPKTITKFFDLKTPSIEIRPLTISKLNTALQITLIGGTLFFKVYDLSHTALLYVLQYVIGASTLASGLSYILLYKNSIKHVFIIIYAILTYFCI